MKEFKVVKNSILKPLDEFFSDMGYVKNRRGYIKQDINGRFHAIVRDGNVFIHYDFGDKHITNIPMPSTLGQEQSRIQRYINDQTRKE